MSKNGKMRNKKFDPALTFSKASRTEAQGHSNNYVERRREWEQLRPLTLSLMSVYSEHRTLYTEHVLYCLTKWEQLRPIDFVSLSFCCLSTAAALKGYLTQKTKEILSTTFFSKQGQSESELRRGC